MDKKYTVSYIKGGYFRRLIAVIIDCLILFIATIFIYLFLRPILPKLELWFLLNITFSLIYILYNIFLIKMYGATIGKKIMKLKVVSMEYKNITWGRILLRETIGKWVSSFFNLGYLWIIIDKNRQGWHDKIAGTFVVKVNKFGQLIPGEDTNPTKKAWFLFIILSLPVFLVLFLSILVIFFLFIGRPQVIRGSSMAPTYIDGQYFITNSFAYRFNSPKRGDVVIFKAPGREDVDYIQRIIALPGEEVKIQEGYVYINNEKLEEPYLSSSMNTNVNKEGFVQEGVAVIVPQENYFVLGDNRAKSSDSRLWGFLPQTNIIGKFWFRYF